MSILINILLVLVVLISVVIVMLVLMQRPKNEGLGAAFGGGMTENLFGAQATNVLQKLTRNLGIAFFVFCATLSWLYVKQTNSKSDISKQLSAAPTPPPATPVPATPEPNTVPGVDVATEAVTPPAPPKPGTPPVPGAPAGEDKKPDGSANPPPTTPPPAPAPAPGSPESKPPAATPAPAPPAPAAATPAPAPAATPKPDAPKPPQ